MGGAGGVEGGGGGGAVGSGDGRCGGLRASERRGVGGAWWVLPMTVRGGRVGRQRG